MAELAAISVDYYTRLEQGRVQASASVLAALVLFGLLAVFPWTGTAFYIELVTKIMIMSIFALRRASAFPPPESRDR